MRIAIAVLATIVSLHAFAFEEEECMPLSERICVDQGERTVDGFRVSSCWKYEQKFKCLSKEENNCVAFESNRGCIEASVVCKEESLGRCKHSEKQFVCTDETSENQEVKLVGSEFTVLKDEKDLSQCKEEEINKQCKIVEEKCVEGSQTRNIKGKEVNKECWKWERQYECRTDT